MPSITNAETLLALDVGSVNTRANLFDVVDGRFRLLASGRVPTTARYPLLDICEGARLAIERIQQVTGRRLLDESEALIIPSTGFGTGIDMCTATLSAGLKVRSILVGLMPGISVSSLRRLASSMQMDVEAVIHLSDRRQDHDRIQLIVDLHPDIILLAGGTDGGASSPLLEMVDIVGLAADRFPRDERPVIVFCGNRHLGATIVERLVERVQVILAPNVRPGMEKEDLTSTRIRLEEVMASVRFSGISGYDELKQWTGEHLMPSQEAFGRIVRYLSAQNGPGMGVLGVDIGAAQVTMAAGDSSDFSMHIAADRGMGESLPALLEKIDPGQILHWLPFEMDALGVQNFAYTKSLYPSSVPVDRNDLYLELAFAREVLRDVMRQACRDWPDGIRVLQHGVLPPRKLILVSGAVLTRTPEPGLAVLAVLDGLQPTGVTTLMMDPYGLVPSLGVMAEVVPVGTVQLLESSTMPMLAVTVAPLPGPGSNRSNLHLRLDSLAGGHLLETEVEGGELRFIPFKSGMEGSLMLRPDRNMDLGFGGPGKAGIVNVKGSIAGIVVDLRGRPLSMPADMQECAQLNLQWLDRAGVSSAAGKFILDQEL